MLLKKNLLFLLLLSSAFYIFKLFKITATTPRSPTYRLPRIPCTSKNAAFVPQKLTHHATSDEEEPLTLKELSLLTKIIGRKQHPNLLFFGLNPQFLSLVEARGGERVIFLEDDGERIQRFRPRANRKTSVHKVKYKEEACRAYELLRHGRERADCRRGAGGYAAGSGCRLAMGGLPQEVHERNWDVVVVDGPRGDRPNAPGRMAAIYTAAVIARMGLNGTDVLVHDVDRMIEKWYSWEFLCHENLMSAKGKLWRFRVQGILQPDDFAMLEALQVHMFYTRGPPSGGDHPMSNNSQNAYSATTSASNAGNALGSFGHLSAMERKIVQHLINSAPGDEGIHVSDLTRNLGPNINAEEVSNALDRLTEAGHIFNTIDEFHYQIST